MRSSGRHAHLHCAQGPCEEQTVSGRKQAEFAALETVRIKAIERLNGQISVWGHVFAHVESRWKFVAVVDLRTPGLVVVA